MSEGIKKDGAASEAIRLPRAKVEGNPAFRMMAAVTHDRRCKRKIQQKWCDSVAHLANEPLSPQHLPRSVTVFIEAPPGDYLLSARDYFKEYVKPILVASAIEWELVEGRKEGDIQRKLADKIRERRAESERSSPESPDTEATANVKSVRQKGGVRVSHDGGGDIVIGRHTWKEYIRGLHEGWLGPLDPPVTSKEIIPEESSQASSSFQTSSAPENEDTTVPDKTDLSTSATETEKSQTHDDHTDKSDQPPKVEGNKERIEVPFISTSQYPSCALSKSTPETFDPAVAVGFPHLLGFFNTPIRIWRYLNQRKVANETGAIVAAFVLHGGQDDHNSYFDQGTFQGSTSAVSDAHESASGQSYNRYDGKLQEILQHEEVDWHKSARAPNGEGEGDKERPWQEKISMDSRISQRIRIFNLSSVTGTESWDARYAASGLSVTKDGDQSPDISNRGQEAQPLGERHEEMSTSLDSFKGLDWRGGADPMLPTGWLKTFEAWLNLNSESKKDSPWQQGFLDEPVSH